MIFCQFSYFWEIQSFLWNGQGWIFNGFFLHDLIFILILVQFLITLHTCLFQDTCIIYNLYFYMFGVRFVKGNMKKCAILRSATILNKIWSEDASLYGIQRILRYIFEVSPEIFLKLVNAKGNYFRDASLKPFVIHIRTTLLSKYSIFMRPNYIKVKGE